MSSAEDTGTVNAEDDGTSYLLDQLDEAMEVSEGTHIIITTTDSQNMEAQQIVHGSQVQHISMEQIVTNDQVQQVCLEQMIPDNQQIMIEQGTPNLSDGSTTHIEVISNPEPASNESEVYTEIRDKSDSEHKAIIILQMPPPEDSVAEVNKASKEQIQAIKDTAKKHTVSLLEKTQFIPLADKQHQQSLLLQEKEKKFVALQEKEPQFSSTPEKEQTIPEKEQDSISSPNSVQVFPFVCGICSEKFITMTNYFAHFKLHKEYQSALHCCEKITETSEKGEKQPDWISCGICYKEFPSICLIHDHMLNVENISDYRYNNYTVLPVYGTVDNAKSKSKGKTKGKRGRSPRTADHKLEELEDKTLASDGSTKSKRQRVNETDKTEENETDLGSCVLESMDSKTQEPEFCTPKKLVNLTSSSGKKTASQIVFERNFEMSTRRRTYTMPKETETETPKRNQKASKSTKQKRTRVTQTEGEEEDNEGKLAEDEKEDNSDDGVTLEVQEVKDAETVEDIADYLMELSQDKTPKKGRNLDGTEPSEDAKDKAENGEQKDLMAHANSRVEDSLSKLQRMKRKQLLKTSKAAYLPCDICGMVLPRKGLARHRVVHTQSRDYYCDICDKGYKSKSHLTDHIRVVHAQRQHQCTACEKVFKTPIALDKHMSVHLRKQEIDPATGQLLVQQEDINKSLKESKDSAEDNDSNTEKPVIDDDKLQCTICKKYLLKTSMKKHMLAHSHLRQYKCEHCGAAFKLQSHLKSHINNVHLKLMNYKCSICETPFKLNKELLVHKTSHLDPKDEYYSDKVVTLLQQEEKDRELRKRNQAPRTIECDICGKTINYKRFNRHRSIHNKSKDYACDICNKKFNTQRYVYDHKLKVHTDVKTFCDICGQFFKGKGYLEKHRQIHGPRDKICTVCSKGFTTDFYLKMHMKTHQDKNAVTCSYCPITLSSRSRLAVHMAEKHNVGGKRPCKYCFQVFPTRQRARLHERRIHEGFEVKKRIKHLRDLNIKQEQVTVGDEYHVILTDGEATLNMGSGETHLKIMTEKLEPTQEVTSVELIDAATNSEMQDTVTHAQLLDAVLKSSETQVVDTEVATGQEEIIQHVVEIPESAEQVCALVLYPDGTYRLVNPDDIAPDAKVVAEVATR